MVNDMLEWLVDPCLDFVRLECRVGHGRLLHSLKCRSCSLFDKLFVKLLKIMNYHTCGFVNTVMRVDIK